MRRTFALAAVALVVAGGPGWGASMTDAEAMAVPCRTYLASPGSAVYEELVDAIVTRLSALSIADRFGSACNMGDYVTAECRAHRSDTIGTALRRLEQAGRMSRLPLIPQCGA